MDGRLKELGALLAAEREEQGQGLRYSAVLKREVIAAVALARESGRSTSGIAQALDISIDTLRRWLTCEAEQPGFRPVRVQPGPDAVVVAVVSPGGFRAEGLDLGAAATLLRLLG